MNVKCDVGRLQVNTEGDVEVNFEANVGHLYMSVECGGVDTKQVSVERGVDHLEVKVEGAAVDRLEVNVERGSVDRLEEKDIRSWPELSRYIAKYSTLN